MSEQELNIAELKKELKEYTPTILLLFAIMILTILLVKFILPEALATKKTLDDLKESNNQIANLEKKLNILQGLQNDNLIEYITKSQKLVPASSNIASLVTHINNLESESGARIEEFNIKGKSKDEQNKGIRNIVDLTLTLIGSKEEVFRFLNLLNNPSSRIVKVRQINLEKEQELIRVELEMSAFFTSFPNKIGAVAEELPEITKRQRELLEQIAQMSTDKLESTVTIPPFAPRENPFED